MDSSAAHTSIVMVSYRTGEVLYSALASALSQAGLKELILVDNGNSPETIARLEEIRTRHPQLQFISGHGNIGFARGCNLGASRATGEFILLLNPDCILPEEAIKQAVQSLGEHKAMLVGANIVHPDGTPQRGARRHLMTPRNVLSECLHLSGFTGEYVNFHDMAMPDTPQVVPAISGAFMLMRRTDYVKLGGLDEDYFLHMEDMDLCLRVSKAGGKTLFLPQMKVVHHLSTSDASSVAVEWHKTKGFLLYFDRYHQASTPAWVFLALKAAIYARLGVRVVVSKLMELGAPKAKN